MSPVLRWLFSRRVRHAIELRRYIQRRLQAKWDVMTPEAVAAVREAAEELRTLVANRADKSALAAGVTQLAQTAQDNLPAARHPVVNENVELALVVAVLVLGMQTFFLQLMKIPSASAQPTLFGVRYTDLKHDPAYRDFQIPAWPQRVVDQCLFGISYYHVTAREDGELQGVEPPRQIFPFVSRQRFRVGNRWYSVWFPPENLMLYAGLSSGHRGLARHRVFRRGEDILKVMVHSGDRLLVDRLSYNFVRPKRGDIIVFTADGIRQLEPGAYYIKRLVGLGGEHVRIGNDRHLVIDGTRLDAATPHFENVYTFYNRPPRESRYSGHVNEAVARRYGFSPGLAPLFPDGDHEFVVRPHHYLAMGDNTLNSHDSRAWGDFPEKNVVGRYFFVYWPLSSRFGWGNR